MREYTHTHTHTHTHTEDLNNINNNFIQGNTTIVNSTSTRIIYYDVLRIIAIFLVIFNHTKGFSLYANSTGIMQCIYLVFSIVDKIAVALFFMISGALLLNKEESYKDLFSKRIKRFIEVIIIFEVGYVLLNILHKYIHHISIDFSLSQTVRDILSGKINETYWFLYSYIQMLLFLPFLRYIAKNIKKSDMTFLIILRICFVGIIPIINLILTSFNEKGLTLSEYISILLATGTALFYPLLGYYIDKKINITKIKKFNIINAIFISIIAIIIPAICTIWQKNVIGKYTQNYLTLFTFVLAIGVFLFIKYLFSIRLKNINIHIKNAITCIGSLSFGMYLLDPYLVASIGSKIQNPLAQILPTFMVSIIWCCFSMLVGGFITMILKKLPIFKKIL